MVSGRPDFPLVILEPGGPAESPSYSVLAHGAWFVCKVFAIAARTEGHRRALSTDVLGVRSGLNARSQGLWDGPTAHSSNRSSRVPVSSFSGITTIQPFQEAKKR